MSGINFSLSWDEHGKSFITSRPGVPGIKCYGLIHYRSWKRDVSVPSRHMTSKWCQIDVDATSWRRIDVDMTSFWRRWYDVILTSCARWVKSVLAPNPVFLSWPYLGGASVVVPSTLNVWCTFVLCDSFVRINILVKLHVRLKWST